MVEILTDNDKSRLEYNIGKLIINGYSIHGFSTSVKLSNDLMYSVIMVKDDSNP